MSNHILYIVNELPFPPRNGVTIPAYHYLKELSGRGFNVDLLYLPRHTKWKDLVLLEQNAKLADNLWVIPLEKKSKWLIAISQLLLIKPSFYGYHFDEEKLLTLLKDKKYNSIIYTPISATIVFNSVQKSRAALKAKQIGILNDCYSYAIKIKSEVSSEIFAFSLRERIKMKIEYFNSYLIKHFESKIVKKLDILVCQTPIDAIAFTHLNYKNKLLILSNGAPEALYEKKLKPNSISKVLFLGSLNGKYTHVSEWLLLIAWPFIHSRYPHLKLKLVGKGLSPHLIQYIKTMASVEYHPFVESIDEVYDDVQVLLAPIFMHCGLINKVVESMAAGVVVIGDATAFNGIPGFIDGKHGLISEDLKSMTDNLNQILENDKFYNELRFNAKDIIVNHFNWKNKVNELIDTI